MRAPRETDKRDFSALRLSITYVNMSDRLPPLTALRAFEAAARHMSFAKAAEELHVTPAALSFQVKSLEEHLGEPLFHRLNRAVELTEAGKTLAPGTRDGFERLSAAWARHPQAAGQHHADGDSRACAHLEMAGAAPL